MLQKIALVLIAVWLAGVLGLFDIGDAVHLLILTGGMLLLLGIVKGRESAIAANRTSEQRSRRT